MSQAQKNKLYDLPESVLEFTDTELHGLSDRYKLGKRR